MTQLIESLAQVLPPILWRHLWPQYQQRFGVPFARGTMQNYDSERRGPRSGKIGNRIYYRKEDYLIWLEQFATAGEKADE